MEATNALSVYVALVHCANEGAELQGKALT